MSTSSSSAPDKSTVDGTTLRLGMPDATVAWLMVADPRMTSYVPVFRAEGGTPRPVLALPWGSKSISNTDWPTATKAVARFTAVVVLPTPPFWLAIANNRVAPSENFRGLLDFFGVGSIGLQTLNAQKV